MSLALFMAGFKRMHALRVTAAQRNPIQLAVLLLSQIVLLLPLGALAASTERAGRVLVTTGAVEAVATDGTTRTLERRTDVYSGETLRTAGKARAQVRFTDGALLSLRPDSELKIDDYHFENLDAADHKYLRLIRGGFRTVTGRIGRTNRAAYRVSTPLAVIGVRGTDWEVLQVVSGPLLLGVNQGGITAQSTLTNKAADVGSGAGFNFAQITPDGAIQLLPEAPAALVQAAAVEKGEKPAAAAGGEGGKAAAGEEKGGAADASAAPPPPAAADTGTGSTAAVSTDPAAAPTPAPSISTAASGAGGADLIAPVFTAAEEAAIVADTHLAVVAGMAFSPAGQQRTAFGLVGPSVGDQTPSFNFVFQEPAAGLPGTDRLAGLMNGSHFVDREGVTLNGVQDNVGGVTGLTFGRYVPSAVPPPPLLLQVFTDAHNKAQNFDLTSPFVFALFNPTSIANLTGRLVFSPAANLISVSTGTVSTVVGELTLNVNLGSGSIERGVLDVGFGTTPDALVFAADLQGTVSNVNGRGALNASVRHIVLQDNVAHQTLAARGTVSGAFTGSTAIPSLVLSFDYADDVPGRDEFARGVVLFNGKTAPPLATSALTASELTLLQRDRFFFVATPAELDGGAAAGPATDAQASLGSPLLTGNAVDSNSSDLLTPSDPGFSDLPADIGSVSTVFLVARQGDAPTVGFRRTFTVSGTQSLSWGQWAASPGAPVRVVDAKTGLIELQRITVPLFWATALPVDINSLTGRTTFSSSGAVDFQGIFGTGTGERLPILGVSTSFAVDFATGQISAGHFFAVTERSNSQDLGFDVDFVGQVVNSAGKAFARLAPTGGTYRGNTPLNMQLAVASGLFTATTFPAAPPQHSFVMSFFSQSAPATGNPDFVSGTLVIGQANDVRLSSGDIASGLGRIGIAVFNPVDAQGNVIAGLAHNLGAGTLLGRSGAVTANAAGFGVFANTIATVGDQRFFGVPADSIVRQSTTVASRVDTAVGGSADVGWGEWLAVPAIPATGSPAKSAGAQTNPANEGTVQAYNADVLFASVSPTPQVLTGSATYSGAVGTPGFSMLARGGALGSPSAAFQDGSLAVNVDFSTGNLNGNLQVCSIACSNTSSTNFNAGFSGHLNRNIAQLSLDSLQVISHMTPSPGAISASSITGVVAGATGGQFVNGFQLVGAGQHVEGLMTAGKH